MSRKRILAAAVFLAATWAARAQGQLPMFLPAGSTPQGDYLRGVGVAAAGIGMLEMNEATANSINTDTFIRWNEYVSAVVEYQARKNAERRQREKEERNTYIAQRLKRIAENPEALDVEKGDALNSLKDRILAPSVSESAFKYARVALPVDVVRKIPFKIDRESLTFSMARITARGTAKWPPALQGEAFDAVRKAYDRAVDRVIEEQIEGRLEKVDIERVGAAIDDLENKLREIFPADKDKLFMDAKRRIDDFRKCYDLILKSHQVQLAVADLDKYSGTTVRELLLFMQKHRLGFGGALTPEERRAFPVIYASLKEQDDKLTTAPRSAAQREDPAP